MVLILFLFCRFRPAANLGLEQRKCAPDHIEVTLQTRAVPIDFRTLKVSGLSQQIFWCRLVIIDLARVRIPILDQFFVVLFFDGRIGVVSITENLCLQRLYSRAQLLTSMRMPLKFLQSDTRVDRPPSLRHRSPPLPWPGSERGSDDEVALVLSAGRGLASDN